MNNINLQALYSNHFESLRGNIDAALANQDYDQLLIYSGAYKLWFLDDHPYPYRVNSYFKAVVPLLDHPQCWIIWRLGEIPLLLFYQPIDIWHQTHELPDEEWVSYLKIEIVTQPGDARRFIDTTKRTAFIGDVPPPDSVNRNATHKPGGMLEEADIQEWELGDRNPAALLSELDWYRSYKTPYEQACIKEACRISAGGHSAAREAFFSGGSELEIELAFQQGCNQHYLNLAYHSTVALNEHAAVLHYAGRSTQRYEESDRRTLLIDAAAEYRGYTADISRTYVYRPGLFADLLHGFEHMQEAIVAEIKPGQRYLDNTVNALLRLGALLKDVGVLKSDPETALETGVINTFMPHGLSHFLGLQVHDKGWQQKDKSGALIEPEDRYTCLPESRRRTRLIEPNQVLTVEPGVYFIDSLLKQLKESEYRNCVCWDTIKKLQPYGGIRIEDDVLITETGVVNLTRQAFAEAQQPA